MMVFKNTKKGKSLFLELKSYVSNYEAVVDFVSTILSGENVQFYFAWKTMLKPLVSNQGNNPVDTTRVVVVADDAFFEFILSDYSLRYDVMLVRHFYRIEEIHYIERGLDGKDVPVLEATLDGMFQDLTESISVRGASKVKELEKFLDGMRSRIIK